MFAAKKGQLVFLSVINGITDYNHQQFVQGIFESNLSTIRASNRMKRGNVYLTLANIHKAVMPEFAPLASNDRKFGIFGPVNAAVAAKQIIRGVRQKKLYVTLPSFMTHAFTYFKLCPRKTGEALVDLIYRVY